MVVVVGGLKGLINLIYHIRVFCQESGIFMATGTKARRRWRWRARPDKKYNMDRGLFFFFSFFV